MNVGDHRDAEALLHGAENGESLIEAHAAIRMDRRPVRLVERRFEDKRDVQFPRGLYKLAADVKGKIEVLENVESAEQHERQIVPNVDA
jgi:hypothetical protein